MSIAWSMYCTAYVINDLPLLFNQFTSLPNFNIITANWYARLNRPQFISRLAPSISAVLPLSSTARDQRRSCAGVALADVSFNRRTTCIQFLWMSPVTKSIHVRHERRLVSSPPDESIIIY